MEWDMMRRTLRGERALVVNVERYWGGSGILALCRRGLALYLAAGFVEVFTIARRTERPFGPS
jgi:hypothetical protein